MNRLLNVAAEKGVPKSNLLRLAGQARYSEYKVWIDPPAVRQIKVGGTTGSPSSCRDEGLFIL